MCIRSVYSAFDQSLGTIMGWDIGGTPPCIYIYKEKKLEYIQEKGSCLNANLNQVCNVHKAVNADRST